MADANTSRLCVQIVHTQFGPLSAKVVDALLTRGRLSIYQLTRFTSLKPRIVLTSVIVLTQHNLVWHDESDQEGEVLEVNIEECLSRLRFGRFVWQAEQLFGKEAADIVQLILDHGKLRPPTILAELVAHNTTRTAAYSQAIYRLVSESYLKPSTILSHRSPRDKIIKYEAEEKAKIPGLPTTKQLREARETAEARLKREEAEAEGVGLKPKTKKETKERGSKRKAATHEDEVDPEVYFRVNYGRFLTHIRNELIENVVRERYNNHAAIVMRATLKATQPKQLTITDARTDPTSVANISLELPEDIDLSDGLILSSSMKKASNITFLKDYLGILAAADNPTPSGRASSFVSLASSKVQVEFELISRRLRRSVLEAVTKERHGDGGIKILRLLLDTGKMDEKQISKVTMMAGKDVRSLLSALSTDSLISIQEVPKSADRNPSRTFYLWYVDLQKAYHVLLGSLYKTLYNISVRRSAEGTDPIVKAALEKWERIESLQQEGREASELMSRNDKELLADWEHKLEMLGVLERRVEEAVFILRDLGVFGDRDE